MANRLTKVVTRGGDKGETSLGDGTRTAKDDPRITLIGDVDELNSFIGAARAQDADSAIDALLKGVQHDLFDLGGGLCFPGAPVLTDNHLTRLEEAAAEFNQELTPLKEFILPAGSPAIAALHIARAVCRRVERTMAGFVRETPEAATGLQYLNRLSDCLFLAARLEAKRKGVAEIYWRKVDSANPD